MTTFILLWIILAGAILLVAHYSPYKSWMLLVAFIVGTGLTLVFMAGGSDD